MVSAQRSRVGWITAHNNEQTNESQHKGSYIPRFMSAVIDKERMRPRAEKNRFLRKTGF